MTVSGDDRVRPAHCHWNLQKSMVLSQLYAEERGVRSVGILTLTSDSRFQLYKVTDMCVASVLPSHLTASCASLGPMSLTSSAAPLGAGAAKTLQPASGCSCALSRGAVMVMSGKLRVPPEMATSSYARVSSLCGSTVLVPDLVPASRAADDFSADPQCAGHLTSDSSSSAPAPSREPA